MTVESFYAGTPFWRYIGEREVTDGPGYFDGASGSGIDEFYAYYFDSGDPNLFIYQSVVINRMSVSTETETPIPQPDFRGVSVLVKNGIENLVDGTGMNAGPEVSARSFLCVVTI